MIYRTASGSVYEVQGKRARRIFGVDNPTPRVGQDGQWREFVTVQETDDGRIMFDWDGEGHCTMTAPVVERVG